MKNSVVALLLAVLVLLSALIFKVWQSRQVTIYTLEVVNQSAQAVDYIRLFGSGAQDESIVKFLMPGRSVAVSVTLKKQGELKFEVSQAGSIIDTYVDQNITAIDSFRQRLLIYPNHRYVVSNYDGLLRSD